MSTGTAFPRRSTSHPSGTTAEARRGRRRVEIQAPRSASSREDLAWRDRQLAWIDRELRALDEAERRGRLFPGLVGYAMIWREPIDFRSQHYDHFPNGYYVTFAPGAFDQALRLRPRIRCWVNHCRHQVIGDTDDGTLRLTADALGLRMELTPYDNPDGRLVMEAARRGLVSGASITWNAEGSYIRHDTGPTPRCTVFHSQFGCEISVILEPKQPGCRSTWLALNSNH